MRIAQQTPDLELEGYRRFAFTGRGFVAATITIAPIPTGKKDGRSAFVAERRCLRRIEWAQSQRRRGITRRVVTLPKREPALAVVHKKTVYVEEAGSRLTKCTKSFDVWYRGRVADLHNESYNTQEGFECALRSGPRRGRR